jgi:two-component system, NtrC family, response regulator PilR
MSEKISALLVYQISDTLRTLRCALERQGVHVTQVGTCAQAKQQLAGSNPPELIFTGANLPDGTWADILAVAEKAALPVNVIVVARVVDTRFYVEAIEAGAFDFIAPPFIAPDLAYVVRSAAGNAMARRTIHTRASQSAQEALFSPVRPPSAHVVAH